MIRPSNRPVRHLGGARAKLAENLRKITRKSDWTLVNGDKNWTNEIEEVLRYKTAQKAVKKVNKKVSGHTYGQIRNQKYTKHVTNGTTVK